MSTPITLTGAYTCTHHNDQQRAACPVCLVPALTAERDQLRAQLHALQLVCGTTDADKFSTWVDRANARAERAEAEVERLRSDRDCEKRLRKDADEFRENAIARAERAEADAAAYLKRAESFRKIGDEAEAELATERAEVERLNALGSWAHTCIHHTDEERKAWGACPCCAKARAERAEADLAALEQSFDDNCRGVVRFYDDLAAEREKVRTLRETMKTIANSDNYVEQYFDPCQLALSALAGMEEDAK